MNDDNPYGLQDVTVLASKYSCLLCAGPVEGCDAACPDCMRRIAEGKDADVRLLRWWSNWGFDEFGKPYSLNLTADELVLLQPQLRMILDNWSAALRLESVRGSIVTWATIHQAIRGDGIELWCSRFDPHP